MPVIENEEVELKHEALTIIEQAKIIRIVDQPSYDNAAKLLLEGIIPFRKKWLAYWNPLRESAYSSYKGILDKFNEADKLAEQAERQVKAAIRAWDEDQERIRQELQRKAQEEAERKEQEERLAAAVIAEESGASEQQVEQIISAPVQAVAAPVEPTYAKASGVSGRDNWKAKVIDFKMLVKAVASGKVPIEYLQANEAALNARAKADKQTLSIPGVVAFNERIISGRGR
jgi:hypothetical protein